MSGGVYQLSSSRRWRFRETGREAIAVALISTRDRELVVFRFVDETPTRKVAARSFLRDFERTA